MLRCLVATLALFVFAAPAAAQSTYVAVVVGLAGTPEHAELFQRWAGTLVDGSIKMGVTPDRLVYLSDKAEADAKRITGRSTKDEITRAFDTLARAGADDVVFVVLIGHGTFDGKVAKFNLPGPDITPADFEPLLTLPGSGTLFTSSAMSPDGNTIGARNAQGRLFLWRAPSWAEIESSSKAH